MQHNASSRKMMLFVICPLSSFFFFSSRNHRDLHSFPTRRSSDLENFSSRKFARARDRSPQWAKEVCMRDRKSTRLNSSHSSISYAVFCLKKKMKSVRG